jgi:hypothetical protein
MPEVLQSLKIRTQRGESIRFKICDICVREFFLNYSAYMVAVKDSQYLTVFKGTIEINKVTLERNVLKRNVSFLFDFIIIKFSSSCAILIWRK